MKDILNASPVNAPFIGRSYKTDTSHRDNITPQDTTKETITHNAMRVICFTVGKQTSTQ